MRIGVDATCWQNNRGYGRHARALLTALVRMDEGNRYTFVMDSREGITDLPARAEARVVGTETPTALAAAAQGRRSMRDMWRMSRALSDPSFEVLLFPTIYSYVPVFSRARKIVMIHDVIAETFPDLTLPHLPSRLFWKLKVWLGRRQADAIVTVSEHSRDGIVRMFQLPPEEVFVVGEASDPIFRRLPDAGFTSRLRALGLHPGQRLIVYVGGFSPHKNLAMLVEVFASLTKDNARQDLRLVMVGEYEKEVFHSYAGTIRKRVSELGLDERVVFTGYLPDEELVALLNLAAVLALPSWLEGFGLPAVEAAACGCPVIATTASPLPSLLGGGGIYLDPDRPDRWEEAFRLILESPERRAAMSRAGLAAAAGLTWEEAARQMIAVLQS